MSNHRATALPSPDNAHSDAHASGANSPFSKISAQLLSAAEFAPYGQVIEAAAATISGTVSANQGTAKRRNWLADLQNLRPDDRETRPNMCVFRVQPAKVLPFPIRLLERHPHSTQCFIPMSAGTEHRLRGYLVIVCLNGPSNFFIPR